MTGSGSVQRDMEAIFGLAVVRVSPNEITREPVLNRHLPTQDLDGRSRVWRSFHSNIIGIVTLGCALLIVAAGAAISLSERTGVEIGSEKRPTFARTSPLSSPTTLRVSLSSKDFSRSKEIPSLRSLRSHRFADRQENAVKSPKARAGTAYWKETDQTEANRLAAEKLRQEYADDAAITRRLNEEALGSLQLRRADDDK